MDGRYPTQFAASMPKSAIDSPMINATAWLAYPRIDMSIVAGTHAIAT
ncbi:hypothetical protein [Paraburkholderia diazotrophica]|nr:hypothetical protein [Paraburkholderia diazotrophica]